jgi:hypothetical protein
MGSSTCITGRTRKRPWQRALNTQLDLDFNIWVSWKTGVGNLRFFGFYFFIFFNSFSFNSPPRSGLRFHSLVLKKKGIVEEKVGWVGWKVQSSKTGVNVVRRHQHSTKLYVSSDGNWGYVNNRYTNNFFLANSFSLHVPLKRNVFISTGMSIINFPRKTKFYLLYMEIIDTRSAILWIANFVYEIDNTTSWLGVFCPCGRKLSRFWI